MPRSHAFSRTERRILVIVFLDLFFGRAKDNTRRIETRILRLTQPNRDAGGSETLRGAFPPFPIVILRPSQFGLLQQARHAILVLFVFFSRRTGFGVLALFTAF